MLTQVSRRQAVISILDHATRRDINDTQSTRVIGALVGTRSEDGTEVDVRSVFAIPHTENEDQVEVDVEYQKNMLALALRGTSSGGSGGAGSAVAYASGAQGSGSGRETLLGWYTTSLELNSFSALIQNFFASPETGTYPHPAVHLTISTEPGSPIRISAYISSPVGVNADRTAESCMFVAVPHRLQSSGDSERAALEAIASAADSESRSAPLVSDIEGLSRALETTSDLLDRTSEYVSAVLDEETEPNQALGQFLMNALSVAPKVEPGAIEQDFSNHVQDVLMVSYLANTVRTQIELAQRLATAALVPGDKEGEKKDGEGGDKGERGQGQRGGRRGGRGGGRGGGQQREFREPRENGE
jgi:translation initiation factor 3 subunit F